VVVESLEYQVALVPWCTPVAKADPAPATPCDPTSTISTLRDHYDLVLVDLGTSRKSEHAVPTFSAAEPWIDAVILVHNVRNTPQGELNQASARLREAGIPEVAVVENCV
jgi:hypothetical protein